MPQIFTYSLSPIEKWTPWLFSIAITLFFLTQFWKDQYLANEEIFYLLIIGLSILVPFFPSRKFQGRVEKKDWSVTRRGRQYYEIRLADRTLLRVPRHVYAVLDVGDVVHGSKRLLTGSVLSLQAEFSEERDTNERLEQLASTENMQARKDLSRFILLLGVLAVVLIIAFFTTQIL